jgi:hypothetical protein
VFGGALFLRGCLLRLVNDDGVSDGRKFILHQEQDLGRPGIGARSHDSVVVIRIERSDRHGSEAGSQGVGGDRD